ncbi:PfkB family carbohydrate kinase, partial [Neisseria dentiae]
MKVTSFGEVLWDDFPGGKVLGGAPLNVLVRLRSLGVDTSMISSRGDDADGEELLRQIESKNVNTDLLQVCKDQATSLVKVHLDACGSASYEIVYPCAWDRIQVEEAALQRVAESDAFIYGSLSTRDEVSR